MTQHTTNTTTGGDHQHQASAPGMPPLLLTELENLPAMVDLMTAARALRIGRTKAYDLARLGEFPCRIIRIGDLYRVPTTDLLRLLGAADTPALTRR
jgi:hypothetical protein